MKNVRLFNSGFLGDAAGQVIPATDLPAPSALTALETDVYVERPCLLVYDGEFESMDGEVTITAAQVKRLVRNFNSFSDKFKRFTGLQVVPLKDCPPMQLDHAVTADKTVGRVVGPLWEAEIEIEDDATGEIKTRVGAFGWTRVLGRENVEKVNDGRWIHVSVGADFGKGKLNELSFTPFPAAPHAALLSRFRMKKNTRLSEGNPVEPSEAEKATQEVLARKAAEGDGGGGDQPGAQPAQGTKSVTRITIEEESGPNPGGDVETTTAEPPKNDKTPGSGDPALANKGDDMSYKASKARMEVYEKCRTKLAEQNPDESDEQREERLASMSFEDAERMAAGESGDPAPGGGEPQKVDETQMAEGDGEDKPTPAQDGDDVKKDPPAELEGDDGNAGASDEENKKKLDRLAKLSALKEQNTKLSSALKMVRLAEKKAKLGARLSGLRMSGKITPAEIKKINIDELVGKSNEAVEAVLLSYSQRQPVIDPRIYGTTAATDIGSLSKQMRFAQKEAEVMARSSIHKATKKNLSKKGVRLSETETEDAIAERVRNQVAEDRHGVSGSHLGELQIIHRCMEEGDLEGAKTKLGEYMTRLKPAEEVEQPSDTDGEKHLSALAETIKPVEDLILSTTQMIADLEAEA